MILVEASVGPFRSMNSAQTVRIDPKVTVLVGMNEAGKTVFLKGLLKSRDALALEAFDPLDDFPRRELSGYLRRHKVDPQAVTRLVFAPSEAEIKYINAKFGLALPPGWRLTTTHTYDNRVQIELDAAAADPARQAELGQFVGVKIPRFLYFSEYDVLPGKVNLGDLAQRVTASREDPKQLAPRHRGVLALLRMADVSLADLAMPRGYEELKAKIEAVSLNLTDQVMEFWKQNEDLEVEVDIKTDSFDEPPFHNGPNLYLRIKNRRHRGVSMPFDQRSRGFIWFFSFLVWFDSVQQQLDAADKNLRSPVILLLDEPGLALHALAQADFLRYIDRLAGSHQVIYTTHSPFMLDAQRLQQVRLVEDRAGSGTFITEDLAECDPRTVYPLRAALGWSLLQALPQALPLSDAAAQQHLEVLLAAVHGDVKA